MQIPPQIRLHALTIAQVHLPGIRLRLQRPRQRDRARHDAARARAERRGGVGEGREDGVGADEVGLEGPAGGGGGEVAEEDVDEEGGLERGFLDAQVGDPFSVVACGEGFWGGGDVGGWGGIGRDAGGDGGGDGGVACCGGGGGGEDGEGGVVCGAGVGVLVVSGVDATLLGKVLAGRRAVECVHGCLGGGGGPVAGFWVVVAEGGGVAGGIRGPEVAAAVLAERFERGVLVDCLTGLENCVAEVDRLAVHPAVGVDGLPDGEEAVNVGVVQPKDGVERRVVNL